MSMVIQVLGFYPQSKTSNHLVLALLLVHTNFEPPCTAFQTVPQENTASIVFIHFHLAVHPLTQNLKPPCTANKQYHRKVLLQ